MERARVSLVFVVMVVMGVNQMVRASEDAEVGQEKCHCSPSPVIGGGGGSVPSTPSLSPPSDGPGVLSPPRGGVGSSPTTPTYSSPPPTPPYTTPSGGASSSPTTPSTTPHRKRRSPSTPSYPSPPSPSSSSSSPTTPSYGSPPTAPADGTPPSTPDYGTPSTGTSPSIPSEPTAPSVPDFSPDGFPPGIPGSGTGSCDFWGSHASSFPDILSIFSSITDVFGSGSSFTPAWGSDMTLKQALINKHKDGYGSLLREGSAALLNSLVNPSFKLRPHQVKNEFNRALVSNLAAAVQGAKFKAANEGRH